MRRLANLFFSLAAVGCALNVLGPEVEVYGRRPMRDPPLALYATLYVEVEACWRELGVEPPGDFARIRWFEADSIVADGRRARGVMVIPGHDITIAAPYRENEMTLRHEMSHEASQRGSSIHLYDGARAICDGGY